MTKSKHWKLYELLPPELYIDEHTGWELIDINLIITIDWLKGLVGQDVKLIANNWHWGGSRRYCGLRPMNCLVGAKMSRHKFGQAIDIISPQMTAAQLRSIIDRHRDQLPHPIRIEADVTWLHIDTDNRTNDKIYYFKG